MDAPHEASRPFDANRDGLIPSGGAAAVLLERWDLAVKRGADILGEVIGYAFSSDGEHLSVPGGDGLARAMREALHLAELRPEDVDCLSAHATSTPAGDVVEAQQIRTVFRGCMPDVLCLKALTGHELWMAGASQVVYGIIMAREGFLAPHPNLRTLDAEAEGLRIPTEVVHRAPRVMLCNAAGFGGTNSCLVLRFTA